MGDNSEPVSVEEENSKLKEDEGKTKMDDADEVDVDHVKLTCNAAAASLLLGVR